MRVAVVPQPLSDPLVALGARELQAYLSRIWTGCTVEVAECQEGADLAITITAGATDLPAQGYALRTLGEGRVEIRGVDGQAALFGCYGLLEELGVRFYLSGDSLPRPAKPWLPRLAIEAFPRTRLRGAFPYFDFLNGPSTWNLEDFRRLIDQTTRLRLNCLAFHFYSFEPFLSFEFRGARFDGYLDTSRTSRWMKRPADLSTAIEIGRKHLERYVELGTFGADSAIMPGTRQERAERAQETICQALAYAKDRGMHIALGIELMDPPLEMRARVSPDERFDGGMHICPSSKSAGELLRAWLGALVETYPTADTYVLWQSETFLTRRTHGCPCERCEEFRSDHPVSAYAPEDLLSPQSRVVYNIADVAQSDQTFLQWILRAYGILKELAPGKRVAISGWYIEHLFGDIEHYVPEDLILTSITEIDPCLAPPFIDHYRQIKRERWLVNWWEIDFRAWLPQPKVAMYPSVMAKVREHAIEGVLMLHWRTRTVDDNARYSALLQWTPELTPQEYYERTFAEEWGHETAVLGAKALLEFEEYERWLTTDMGWQVLAPDWAPPPAAAALEHFSTNSPLHERAAQEFRAKLEGAPLLRERLESVHAKLVEARAHSACLRDGDRPGWWLHRIEYYLLYVDVLEYVCAAVLHYHRALADDPHPGSSQAMRELARAFHLLQAAPVRNLIEQFGERIEDRGDLGTLVALNLELWARYKEALSSCVRFFDMLAVGLSWFVRGRSDGSVAPPPVGPDGLAAPEWSGWESLGGRALLDESRTLLLESEPTLASRHVLPRRS